MVSDLSLFAIVKHIHARARAINFSHRATKSSGFSSRARFIAAPADARRRATQVTCAPFPTPATQNARYVHDSRRMSRETTCAAPPMTTISHTRHAKRTRGNVKMHESPHLPRGSTPQRLPKRPHASGAPRLAREVHIHHAPRTHTHVPRFPTPATRNANPGSSDALTSPRFPTCPAKRPRDTPE